MVTLVSFLLTIFTKFRQLKTNLQALCCLAERIKKGKPTIKVTAEVCSRGLRRAPAEPWTEAAAGATGLAAAGREPTAERHSPRQKPPSTRLLRGCRGQQQNSRAVVHTPAHLPPLLHRTGLMGSLCFWEKSLRTGKCSQENKKRQKERTAMLYGVWLFLDNRVTLF